MELKKIIGLIAGGLALYWYKQDLEKQYNDDLDRVKTENEDYVRDLLKENENLENIVNPDGNAEQAPVVFTAAMRQGGVTLNQTEIILTCNNTADYLVEIGDFQAVMWIAGIKSLKCIPANVGEIKIPAKSSMQFRLYASGGIVIQDYVSCKRALNIMARGKDTSVMKSNTYIPLEAAPVVMNLQYLWYWKGGEVACFDYDVPCSYRWKYAGWVHGTKAGYNAAKENQTENSGTYWKNQEEIDE